MTNVVISILCLSVICVSFSSQTMATETDHQGCFEKASLFYKIDINLLLAIATVESAFDMSATNVNKNGTVDYGVMMINSHWKPKLEEMGIDWTEVTTSQCLNIHVGAWVLASNFERVGVNWYAVGAYNAGFGHSERARNNRLLYAVKVHRSLTRIREERKDGSASTADLLASN